MSTAETITLEDFLPRDRGGDQRAWMNKPWSLGDGNVYATDGRIIARRRMTDAEAGQFEIVPDQRSTGFFISKILECALSNSTTNTAPELTGFEVCQSCHGTGHVPEMPCPDCDGVGEFDRGEHTYECKRCETVGWIDCELTEPRMHMNWCYECGGNGLYIPRGKACTTNGVRLDARYLHRIQGAVLFLGAPTETVGWRLRGFEGALMPIKP